MQKGGESPIGVETNVQKQSRESRHLASVYEGVQLNPATASVAANVRQGFIDGQSNNRKELSVNQPIAGFAMVSGVIIIFFLVPVDRMYPICLFLSCPSRLS